MTVAFPTAASIHEAAGRVGALPSRIKPIDQARGLRGPAHPVRCAAGSNLALHEALDAARPGDVLVASVGDPEFGYWGEVMTEAAMAKGLGGLVIDGCVRDLDALLSSTLPIFSTGLCIRGTDKRPGPARLGHVLIGGVRIERGDLVVGDADGVVSIPTADADAVVARAEAREREERSLIRQLRAGASTIDLLGLR